MNGVVIAMAIFGLVGAITPGPVNVLALRYGLHGGFARPLGYVLGASGSYGALVWLTGVGAAPLLGYPALTQLVRWIGAAYLAYLAWRIATAPVTASDEALRHHTASTWRAVVDGMLVQSLNPKAWLVALSGVVLFSEHSSLQRFCTISVIACIAGVGCWAVAGRLLKAWLAPPHRQRLCNRLLGGVLGLTVLLMLS
jgi:threonine/homoserine/homoserine lactone efflux protein